MLQEADRFLLAETCLRHALIKAPQDGRTCCNLGYVLDRQGKDAEALRQYRRAVALEPENAISQYFLGTWLAFNAFNVVNLGLPNFFIFNTGGVRNPLAGQITSTSTPARQIQLGLKFLF